MGAQFEAPFLKKGGYRIENNKSYMCKYRCIFPDGSIKCCRTGAVNVNGDSGEM